MKTCLIYLIYLMSSLLWGLQPEQDENNREDNFEAEEENTTSFLPTIRIYPSGQEPVAYEVFPSTCIHYWYLPAQKDAER